MTLLEFGRRAGRMVRAVPTTMALPPVFALGKAVKGGIIGANQPANLDNGNLKMQYDFRQLRFHLKQWFGTSSSSTGSLE